MYFKRLNKTLLAFLMALVLVVSSIAPVVASSNSIEDLANYALVKLYEIYDEEKENEWDKIEPYDAYVLSKAGLDTKEWTRGNTNLKHETISQINDLIEKSNEAATKHLAGGYLAAKVLDENEVAKNLIDLITSRIDNNFGRNIYSDAPAIEYLAIGNKLSVIDEIYAVSAATAIINMQFADNGAFGSTYMDQDGDYIDSYEAMTTCQAIRGLYYLSKNITDDLVKTKIKTSIDKSLTWLKDFPHGGEYDPIIDTCEVLMTIKTLGFEGSNEWKDKFNNGLAYILANAPDLEGNIGLGTVANHTAILDLAMVLNTGYQVPEAFIYLHSPKSEISKGGTKQLEVSKFKKIGTKENIDNTKVAWESSNPNIVSVNETGIVTGINAGIATITATVEGLTAQGTVKVLGSSGGGTFPSDRQGIAYLSIRGDSETGTILPSTPYIWTDKEVSVLGMLEETLKDQKISYKAAGGYVSEIAGLAHQKPGYPLSGWKFRVNGQDANKGAGAFILRDGDRVEWYYTLDYTKDEDSKQYGGIEKELEEQEKQEKAQAIIDSFLNYLQEFKDLTKEVVVKNLDKIMDKEKALLRDKELQAYLVDLSQVIDGSKDKIIKDENEKIVILIPEKALDKEVTLTVVEKIAEELPKAYPHKIMAPIFEFGPKGLNFKAGVKIKIPIYLSNDFLPEELSPAYFNEKNNEWEKIPGIIDLAEGFAIIETDHFSKFTVIEKPVKKSFPDVSNDYAWAREAIEILAGQEIISGSNIGFEPSRSITRAEFAQLIYQALVEPDIMPVEFAEFIDVKPNDWFAPALSYLFNTDIIAGYEDGSFRPNQSLSRHEASMILYKLAGVTKVDSNNINIKDYARVPEWARPAVTWAYASNIMTGYEDGSFRGENPITRAESAVMIFNWLKN